MGESDSGPGGGNSLALIGAVAVAVPGSVIGLTWQWHTYGRGERAHRRMALEVRMLENCDVYSAKQRRLVDAFLGAAGRMLSPFLSPPQDCSWPTTEEASELSQHLRFDFLMPSPCGGGSHHAGSILGEVCIGPKGQSVPTLAEAHRSK
jgi:hypothetical protein